MVLILGKIKCCFCKGKKGVIHSVHGYGIYKSDISKRTFFHLECLKEVEENPTRHTHTDVDLAVQINDKLEDNIKHNQDIIKNIKENDEKLHSRHFEALLPSRGK